MMPDTSPSALDQAVRETPGLLKDCRTWGGYEHDVVRCLPGRASHPYIVHVRRRYHAIMEQRITPTPTRTA
jgi:hypothetical protein